MQTDVVLFMLIPQKCLTTDQKRGALVRQPRRIQPVMPGARSPVGFQLTPCGGELSPWPFVSFLSHFFHLEFQETRVLEVPAAKRES